MDSRVKVAFVDYWSLVKNFRTGDVVNTYNPLTGTLESIPGRVTAVHYGIGFLDVEYPWGNERVSPEYLVRMNPKNLYIMPSAIDTSYESWDIAQAHLEDGTHTGYSYANPKKASSDLVDRLAADYDARLSTVAVAAAQCLHNHLTELQAYEAMASTVAKMASDHEIRTALQKAYHPNEKVSLYWNAPGRRYRMNKGELEDGLPNCPKCGTNLEKTHYAKHTKLFVCPVCLFCIKPEDVEGLPEAVADTGFGVDDSDLKTAALKSAAWDKVKKQVADYVRKKYPTLKQYADEVASSISGQHAGHMNIHESFLPTKVVEDSVRVEIEYYVGKDLEDRVRDLMKENRRDFQYDDEAQESLLNYVRDLDLDEQMSVDDAELSRLLEIQKELDGDRVRRWTTSSLRSILSSQSPSPIDVREHLGTDGLQYIHDVVRNGSRSDDLVTQFASDFQSYGLGDAMFLLGASTADGLFDRTAYNSLVDVLEDVRLRAKAGV